LEGRMMFRSRIFSGLSLNKDEINLVQVKQTSKGVEIYKELTLSLEGKTPAEVLKGIEKKAGCKIGSPAVSISTNKIFLKSLVLPSVEEKELARMLPFEVEKHSPFSGERVVWAYEVLRKNRENSKVLLAVARQDVAEKSLKEWNGLPGALELKLMAIFCSVRYLNLAEKKGIKALIYFDGKETQFMVMENETLLFARSFPPVKNSKGGFDMDYLNEEIVRSGLAFQVQESKSFSSLILAGPFAPGEEDIGYLREKTGMQMSKAGNKDLLALGLALRGTNFYKGQINLIPRDWLERKRALKYRKVGVRAIVVFSLAYLVFLTFLFQGLKSKKQRLARVDFELKQLSPALTRIRRLKGDIFSIQGYIAQENSALEVLREICVLMPEGVALNNLRFQKNRILQLRGGAKSIRSIFDFRDRLGKSSCFSEVTLNYARAAEKQGGAGFEIICEMAGKDAE